MKRKLIEQHETSYITCDNESCEFEIGIELKGDGYELVHFIDTVCPLCGENLLTVDDFVTAISTRKIINRLNKWFSWIMIFFPKNTERQTVEIHTHNGIKINKK